MIVSFLILAVVVVLVLVAYRTSRAGYESAPCQVVRASGKFELRDYPALTVVETPMTRAGKLLCFMLLPFGSVRGRSR